MAAPPVDIKKLDVLQAQINVSISQARSLVDSWLPPATSSTGKGAKSSPLYSAVPDDGNDDSFKPKPPRLGLGAPIPKHFYDDDQKLRKDISSIDRLKRRLLGTKRNASQVSNKITQKHHNGNSSRVGSDSEEEEGRSALGKSKRQKIKDEKPQDRSEVKPQDAPSKPKVEASTGPATADERKVFEEKTGVHATTESQDRPSTPKVQAPNGDNSVHEPATKKEKKKKKKKNKKKQNGGNPNPGI